MIELHGTWCETTAAVRARNVTQLVEQIGVIAPSRPLLVDPGIQGLGGSTPREPLTMLAASPDAMAVRADNVALRGLNEELGAALQLRLREREALLAGISVVEVHLHRMEPTTAVDARVVTQRAQEFDS